MRKNLFFKIAFCTLAASLAVSFTACDMSTIVKPDNDNGGITASSADTAPAENTGNKDPDKAKSLKEYIILCFGPITDDYTESVSSDGSVFAIAEDKQYGFMYNVKLDKDQPYSECYSSFANMYEGYIQQQEDEYIDSLVDGFNDTVEFNFFDSEFILAEFSLTDASKAPELTEKLAQVYEKYDDRHFFDEYIIIARDKSGALIGSYALGRGYEAADE